MALATGAAAITTAAITAPLAIKAAGVKAALAGEPDPLLAGVQALVNEIRQELSGEVTCGEFWALQEAADRLEALPGIRPINNVSWDWWRQPSRRGEITRHRSTKWRAIRPAGGLPS
jgi:hypothetical protein